MTPPLTLEQRVERIERLLGLDVESAMGTVPWPLRREAVINAAARLWDVPVEELSGAARTRQIVLPRAAVVMALRCDPPMSYPQIGRALSRDHSSIRNLERIGRAEFDRDPVFSARTFALMRLSARKEATS